MSRHAQVAFAAATALLAGGSILYSCTTAKVETATPESKRAINAHAEQMLNEGRDIFRFDTFGSESFWVKTRLHDAIAGTITWSRSSGSVPAGSAACAARPAVSAAGRACHGSAAGPSSPVQSSSATCSKVRLTARRVASRPRKRMR